MMLNLLFSHIWNECVRIPVYQVPKCRIVVLFFLKKMEPSLDIKEIRRKLLDFKHS